jgi:hypothetical protein
MVLPYFARGKLKVARMKKSTVILAASVFAMGAVFPRSISLLPQARAQESGTAVARRIGAIKTIQGNALTLTADSGAEVSVTVQPNARILRIAPGAKDLKDATPVQLQDLQVGDRVRVRGQAGSDQNQIAALEVIVMARTDLDARRQQEQQDWQKRGMGGLVSSVDPATGTVTVSVTGLGGKKDIAVHTTKSTVFRRYAPDSVKFDDAKPSTLAEIRPGDQLRARGDRAPDGSEVTAQEVVTGSFRNVAGIVNSVDANAGTVNVQDLLSKKAVVVKITPESQLHKLPPEFAQRSAMRLKASMPPGTPGAAANGTNAQQGSQAAAKPQTEAPGRAEPSGGNGAGMRAGAGADFQQILSRMPVVTLADLHKGDALLIVATEGSSSGAAIAITLLSGVEPILQAAPSSKAMMLTPWSLGGAPPGDAAQ